MAGDDSYLAMALELLARAEAEPDDRKCAALRELAENYRRMAERTRQRDGDIGQKSNRRG